MWLFTFCIRRCFPNLTVVGDLTPSHGIRLAAPLEKALLRLGADIGLDFVGQYPNLDIGSGAVRALPCLAPSLALCWPLVDIDYSLLLTGPVQALLWLLIWPCAGLASCASDLALGRPRCIQVLSRP